MSNQGIGFGWLKDEAGEYWVSVTHQSGAMSCTYGIKVDQADQVADEYAKAIKDTAREARRARTGLVLPAGNGRP